MRVLLVAPFVGEIGWELMAWQGRVRYLFERGRFGRLVVLGSAGKAAFYEDMPLDYCEVDLSKLPGQAYEDRRLDPVTRAPLSAEVLRSAVEPLVSHAAEVLRGQGHEVEVLWPAYSGTLWPCRGEYQRFVRYGWRQYGGATEAPSQYSDQGDGDGPSVVFVQRTRALAAENNWPAEAWTELGERLARRGVTTSVFPCEASAAIAALSRCDLAVGQSTGGLHLASLCGCPHVVWSTDDSVLWTPWEMTNRQRYETFWNPLGTPVRYHATDGHPEPREVADWTLTALSQIGRRTGSRLHRGRAQASWMLKSWMTWNVIATQAFRRCPWRLQKMIRYAWL